MSSSYKLGVDGGGTKTEGILVDARGEIVARHLGPGCNPNVAGPEQARLILTDALCELRDKAKREFGASGIAASHLYMAGNRGFWRETAAALTDFGRITVADDSHPVLELATGGRPGLVLHAGTGSFVAARGRDGAVHYAGGTGWRFGDAGSGYELGRRTISRALLEIQGWMPATRLSTLVRDHTQLGDTADPTTVTRYFYQHAEPNRVIAALAPAVFRLASEGDQTALNLVVESASELLDLATRVATKLFPDTPLDTIPAGLSGAVLTHPLVLNALGSRTPLPLAPITAAPIEGVRRLVARDPA
jgi:N-acetylglucosamine kinase-like BadF-type ATPase